LILEGKTGVCGVRKNKGGELYLLVYGRVAAEHVDLIEKKPLYRFLPGSRAYSIGTVGCNFKCDWCQNFDISQSSKEEIIFGNKRTAEQIVNEALENNCKSIAYTYNEPAIWIEFVKEIATLARKHKIHNVLVTNGYLTRESLQFLRGFIDAANVDLKSFSDETYRKFCGAKLKPVLDCIRWMCKNKIHVEITTLIIPGVNDSEKELRAIAKFIFSLDRKGNIAWHISRFFPMYNMKEKHFTPVETLQRAYDIGKKAGLKYVYLGNI
jgi:pyruvate formate lyase activating enzyme